MAILPILETIPEVTKWIECLSSKTCAKGLDTLVVDTGFVVHDLKTGNVTLIKAGVDNLVSALNVLTTVHFTTPIDQFEKSAIDIINDIINKNFTSFLKDYHNITNEIKEDATFISHKIEKKASEALHDTEDKIKHFFNTLPQNVKNTEHRAENFIHKLSGEIEVEAKKVHDNLHNKLHEFFTHTNHNDSNNHHNDSNLVTEQPSNHHSEL